MKPTPVYTNPLLQRCFSTRKTQKLFLAKGSYVALWGYPVASEGYIKLYNGGMMTTEVLTAGALVWDHHQKTYSKRQATSLEKKLEILPKLFTIFVKFSKNTLQNECPILNFFNFTFTMLLQTVFYFLSKKRVSHYASCIP